MFILAVANHANGAFSCLERRQFCNRNTPCDFCTSRGQTCTRDSGLNYAKERQKRGPNKLDNADDASQILKLSQSPQPQKRRGRPPGALHPASSATLLSNGTLGFMLTATPRQNTWAKKAVMNKIKKEKDIREVSIINLIDPQGDKPPGIRRPEVWCEVRFPTVW